MAEEFGKFVGEVQVEWVSHSGPDRDMKLLSDFSYVDAAGTPWRAPKGHVVNGASIPAIFWQIAGPPFVGDYRRASVVHDVYCDTRTESWKRTHRMFFHACRAGGVGEARAKAMYAAVYARGPRWEVATKDLEIFDGTMAQKGSVLIIANQIDDGDLMQVVKQADENALSLEQIESSIDQKSKLSAFPDR